MITLHFIRPGSGTPPVVTEAQVKPGQSLMSAAMAAQLAMAPLHAQNAVPVASWNAPVGQLEQPVEAAFI